jgi:hypothetical protein
MPVGITAVSPMQPAITALPGAAIPDFSTVFDSEVATATTVVVVEAGLPIAAPVVPVPPGAARPANAPVPPPFAQIVPVDEESIEPDTSTISKDDKDSIAPIDLPDVDLAQTTFRAMSFWTELPSPPTQNVAAPVIVAPKNAAAPSLPDILSVSVRPSLQPAQLRPALEKAPSRAGQMVADPTELSAAKTHGTIHEAEIAPLTMEPAQFAGMSVLPADIKPQLAAVRPAPSTPVDQLFVALSRRDPIDRQWLETVIRDVSGTASKTGDVRFRVEPEGFGKITIERTADRLEIGVSEARALAVVEAARPLVLAGASALGVPVFTSSVVLDQSGARHRNDATPRQQIDLGRSEEVIDDTASDAGRYA